MPPEPCTHRTDRDARFGLADLPATASGARTFREQFTRWVTDTIATTEQHSANIILAAYEAVANAAEHAYDATDQPATMNIEAHYRPRTGLLQITIADHGRWKPPQPSATRGRGITLMHALTDNTNITAGPEGTTVTLHWRHL